MIRLKIKTPKPIKAGRPGEHSPEPLPASMARHHNGSQTTRKRKRTPNASCTSSGDRPDVPSSTDRSIQTFFDSDSDSLSSLDELAYSALQHDESDSDIESFENAALQQEAEDIEMLQYRFHSVDEDRPFTYALEDPADLLLASERSEAALEAQWGLATQDSDANFHFEDEAMENMFFGTDLEDCNVSGAWRTNISDIDEPVGASLDTDTAHAVSASDVDVLYDSSEDSDETVDRVGWDCFISEGPSDDESDRDDATATDGTNTDDERPILGTQLSCAQLATSDHPKVAGKASHKNIQHRNTIHAESEQTIMKSRTGTGSACVTATVATGLPRSSYRVPQLATWSKDILRDECVPGIRSEVPAAQVWRRRPRTSAARERKGAFDDAMTSLDEIMHTNDILFSDADEADHATAFGFDPHTAVSTRDRNFQVGAFRRGQQSATTRSRQDSLDDEWHQLTTRNRLKPRAKRLAPVLGLTADSKLHRLARMRKRHMSTSTKLDRQRVLKDFASSSTTGRQRTRPSAATDSAILPSDTGRQSDAGDLRRVRGLPALDAVPTFESLFTLEGY